MASLRSLFICGCAAFSIVAPATSARAEKTLGTMDGITIVLPDDFTCAASVRIGLQAHDPALFADEPRLARLAGQLAALMAFECADAENIMMEGRSGEEIIYQGLTSRRADWGVMTMLAPEGGDAPPPAENAAAAPTAGGLLPDLPEPKAVPEQPLSAAAPESPQDAPDATAIDRLGTIGRRAPESGSDQNYCSAKNFDPGPFSRGRYLSALFDGDFEALDRGDPVMLKVYLLKMNEYFGQGMNFFDPQCAGFYDPDLAPGFMQGVMSNLMSDTQQSGLMVLEGIAQLAQDPLGHMNRVSQIEAEQNAGETDAVRLARGLGCANPVFRRLYENLAAYIRGADPACASGWPGVRLACQSYVAAAGQADQRTRTQCQCIAAAMENAGADRATADWLQANYDHGANFAQVVARHDGLRRQVGACLLD